MKFSTTSFAAGAVAALVIGSGTAYAATGGTFILGKANSAGATTTLTNPNGTALTLKSKAGTPSLRVNSSTKVPYLNADKLDGLDSSQVARASARAGTVWYQGEYVDTDEDGVADAIWGWAQCPAGTVLTGGGGYDENPGGALAWSMSTDPGWWGIGATTPAPNGAAIGDLDPNVWVSAQCVNMKGGTIPGASYRAAAKQQ